MDTQASIIIKFHDDPELCHDLEKTEVCNYFCSGHCVLRIVAPTAVLGLNKYLLLKRDGEKTYKDPSCKFIWEKSKKA